ncbi:MAG: exodeoxyribonuclease large subunit [Chthoniobacter sp.]|jgi:exodeoxyribonuclease VII large subunit|nr:exodeoxyribonuclease large subunit [Chthoniobacter sp.]
MTDLFSDESFRSSIGPRVFTVSEVTRSVRICVEKSVGEVWVEGEICNHRKQASGHQYFGLKDERALLSCVLFFKNALRQPVLADGMLVQVRGEMTVYEARGQYQLVVNLAQAAGAGLLQAKFEALKRKLDAEGLFAPERKKKLPGFPIVLGLVTSPSGAALRDMLNIVQRRAPWVRVIINPVRVQGSGAAAEMASAVREFNESAVLPAVDVIVLCRGGGSAEDLWEFNEEILARAISDSRLPVVSAVGHEIDFTIADLVADLRAPTPSAAAELIVPEAKELLRRLGELENRLRREMSNCLAKWKAGFEALARSRVFREPRRAMAEHSQRVDDAADSLRRTTQDLLGRLWQRVEAGANALRERKPHHAIRLQRQQFGEIAARLSQAAHRQILDQRQRAKRAENLIRVLSPDATLGRGYSITLAADGKIVHSVGEVKPRDKLVTRVRDGLINSTAK